MNIGGIIMRIAVIGVNHNNTPIEIREKVAFSETKKIEAINYLLDMEMEEVIILSTCNRSEIYIVSKDINTSVENVKQFYCDYFKINLIKDYFFIKKDQDAVRHIYNVASGLDSIVLGEDQILGQVKDSLQSAMEIGSSKKILNKLFREAITASKEIKSSLGISDIPLSTSYIAIKNLKEELGTLEDKKVLLIGAGKMTLLALKYFEEEKVETVYMTNRTVIKLKDLCKDCKKLKMTTLDFKDRYTVMDKVDIIFTATSASHTIIKKEFMPKLNKELYIIDLALPRDVEKDVNDLEFITIYDIDDLKKLSDENLRKREELCNKGKAIIEKSIEEFYKWIDGIKFDPVIKSFNDRCKEIENDTLEYINRKLNLDCREKKIIEKMIKSSLKRLVREPINNLKELNKEENANEYIEVINQLFNFN